MKERPYQQREVKERPSQQRVLVVCLVVVLVLVGIALIVGTVATPAAGTIAFELRKYIIQFLLIVALGAVVAFVVDDVNRRAESVENARREAAERVEEARRKDTERVEEAQRKEREAADRERQYATDTLTSLLDRLDTIYRAVKRKRKRLRLTSRADLSKPAYVDAMEQLSDDKEDVEKLWRDILVLEQWLPELIPIGSSVKPMEDYLDLLETEWENVSPTPEDKFPTVNLKALNGFLVKWKSKESTFHKFRDPYYKARSALIALLANKRTGVGRPDSPK